MKHRSLWQILALYAAASWVVLQIVDVVKQNLGLPDWVFPFALLLLLVGLPIIVATALVQGRQVPETVETTAAKTSGTAEGPVPHSESAAHHKLLTWKNALLGGGLAFVLLAVVTSGFMFMRDRGIGPVGSLVASGLLEEKAAIVVADFAGDDPSMARAATQAFRVDLSQSELVKLVEPATLDDALARMELPEDQALTAEVARDLAVREGYPAVIEGELTSVGDGYVITARLADARSEETLASLREAAADANEIIPRNRSSVREDAREDRRLLHEHAGRRTAGAGDDEFARGARKVLAGIGAVRGGYRPRTGHRSARGGRRDRQRIRDGVA